MASILVFPRREPKFEKILSDSNPLTEELTEVIEDLECGPWTTRKLKVPTSASGSLIIECFESADGKRLKGFGGMEPAFCLSNLKIMVQTAFDFEELTLFPYHDKFYTETDFMSHLVNYPDQGRLIVEVFLSLRGKTIRCKLWF